MNTKLEDAGLNRYNKVVKIANLKPTYCSESDKIQDVIGRIISSKRRRIPILSKNARLVGIITYMDILDALLRGENKNSEISTIMVRDIIYCNEDDTIEAVLQKLKMSRRGGIPVVKNKSLVGMISERDFIKYFENISMGVIQDVMTPKPFVVSRNISIFDCLKSVINTRYRRLPMVESGKVIGLVTAYDILEYLVEHNYNFGALKETVEFIAKHDVCTVINTEDVSDAIKLMKKNDVGGIVVVSKDNKLEGIITERDILEQIV